MLLSNLTPNYCRVFQLSRQISGGTQQEMLTVIQERILAGQHQATLGAASMDIALRYTT